ncbi:MAG TPA: hypothetical protein VNT79_08925 [Phycisphaerae bacterium]|nr:hypothetical protein [Phycisphaerae bacterium]
MPHDGRGQTRKSNGPIEIIRERALVKSEGVPREFADAMANVVDTVVGFYRDEFGLDLPARPTLLATLAKSNRPGVLLSGPEEITLLLSRIDQLKSPKQDGLFNVYALAVELGEMAKQRMIGDAKWMTDQASKGLTHYLASEATDRLNAVYSRNVWPDKADYAGEGLRLLEQRLRKGNRPAMVDAAGQWQELTRLQDRKSLGPLLAAMNKAINEKQPIETAIAALPGATDSRGRPKLDRWLRDFRSELIVQDDAKPARRKGSVQLRNDPVTLRHDDNRGLLEVVSAADAPVVFYQLPAGEWYVTGVRIFGAMEGRTTRDSLPTVWICDRDMRPIASTPVPPGVMRGTSPRWREVRFSPAAAVAGEITVCVTPSGEDAVIPQSGKPAQSPTDESSPAVQPDTTKTKTRGNEKKFEDAQSTEPVLKIGLDDSSKGHSAVGTPGWSVRPYEKGDWMIQVIVDSDRTADPLLWRP